MRRFAVLPAFALPAALLVGCARAAQCACENVKVSCGVHQTVNFGAR